MKKARKPAEVFHPGEYLADELSERGWSIGTFCSLSGLRSNVVEELIKGNRNVTRLTALCLANALGVKSQTWINLQRTFDQAADAAGGET